MFVYVGVADLRFNNPANPSAATYFNPYAGPYWLPKWVWEVSAPSQSGVRPRWLQASTGDQRKRARANAEDAVQSLANITLVISCWSLHRRANAEAEVIRHVSFLSVIRIFCMFHRHFAPNFPSHITCRTRLGLGISKQMRHVPLWKMRGC